MKLVRVRFPNDGVEGQSKASVEDPAKPDQCHKGLVDTTRTRMGIDQRRGMVSGGA